MAFTAHNILLPDGTQTFPEGPFMVADGPWFASARKVLHLLYGADLNKESIIDLGCLEGGYAVEFARLGMRSLGIEVRERNFENCQWVQSKLNLPNLSFVRDDAWNMGRYDKSSVIFCCGLLYHLDRPVEFIRLMAEQARDAVIINTHYASEANGLYSTATNNLSPITTHEGLPGRWFVEAAESDRLDDAKWSSWDNKRSFWLTKPAIFQALHDAGFDAVFEQIDHLAPQILHNMTDGSYAYTTRSVFVGVRTGATRG